MLARAFRRIVEPSHTGRRLDAPTIRVRTDGLKMAEYNARLQSKVSPDERASRTGRAAGTGPAAGHAPLCGAAGAARCRQDHSGAAGAAGQRLAGRKEDHSAGAAAAGG